MELKGYIQKVRDPANWSPEFFAETEALFSAHMDAIIRTLKRDKLWEEFDVARCEWIRPGQAQIVKNLQQKVVPDKCEVKSQQNRG
ncbi:MAG: hypothetical protein K1W25_18165, partial [Lachnospiraceae bacterium]